MSDIEYVQSSWSNEALRDYLTKVVEQLDRLNEQQMSTVALFTAFTGSVCDGIGRNWVQSTFHHLPVSSGALCVASGTFCLRYLQVCQLSCID